MAYTQNFKSLGGTLYTVNVDGVTMSSQPPLAAVPIETSEDTEEDIFKPVRTQTGYLRMISMDMATWRSFIPSGATSEPVTLTKTVDQVSEIVWQGYVQTRTYGMSYPATYEEIELPLICPLGALDALDYDISGPDDIVTIGTLLNHIFGKLSGLTFYIYFHEGTYLHIPTLLNYKVIWRNLLSSNAGVLSQRFSCLGLIEELCKFFGWSCRVHGQGIYFTSITDSYQNTKFLKYSVAGLLAPTTGYEQVSMSSLTITDAQFLNKNLAEQFIQGVKKVTVNSELNAYDSIVAIPYKDIYNKYKYNTPSSSENWRQKEDTRNRQQAYILQRGVENYSDEDVAITTYAEYQTDNSEYRNEQCFGRLVIYDESIEEDKVSYGWNTIFEIMHGFYYGNRHNNTPLFTIASKRSFVLGKGVLYITSNRCDYQNTELANFISVSGGFRATCVLRIGTNSTNYKYWNGTSWTTTGSTFQLYFTPGGIKDVNANVAGAEYNGTGIPVSSTLSGNLYFAINDVAVGTVTPMVIYNGYYPLINFEIGFVRAYEDEDVNGMSYSAHGGQFPSEYTVDTIFSTDKKRVVGTKVIRCQLGYGLIFSDTNVLETIIYGNSNYYKPEQRTANLIAAYGSTTRRVLTFDLNTKLIGNDVGPTYRASLNSQSFYPVAVGHSWRDDITTLTLMELPS